MTIKVALTDVFPESIHPIVAEYVPEGWTYELALEPSEENRFRMLEDADFLFSGGAITTDEMLYAAKNLKFVQKTGAGFNNINLDVLKELGIGIANLPGNNAPAVAEHAVLLTLAVYRHLVQTDQLVRAGGWIGEEARGTHRELRGKVVGIVGFGHIGREVATRMRAFGTTIVYSDVRRAPAEVEAEFDAEYLSLEDLMRKADVVSLHTPLFPETRNLINRERIALMKPDAVLINCARGPIVEEPALIEALREGRIYGAGLDCQVAERPGGSKEFWDLPNVTLTPHIAGSALDSFYTMMQRCFANAQSYLAGRPLPAEDVIWLPEHIR
jgi:D-3-phosphoglycerate dehydrogenase